VSQKVGRRISKSRLDEWKALHARLKDWFAEANETLTKLIGWGEYADEDESGFGDWEEFFGRKASGLKFVRVNGHPWLITWTTNAFKDREGEIFSTKAIKEYVEWADRQEAEGARPFEDMGIQNARGELWFYHLPLRMGETMWQAEHKRFLVEGHKIDENPTILKAVARLEKELDRWATSHGFKYREKDRADGVFNWFRKFETSVVPAEKAANPWTPIEVMNVGGRIKMTNDQEEKGRSLFGPDFDKMVAGLEQASKELEGAGVAFKMEEGAEGEETEGEKAQNQDVVQMLKLALGRIKNTDAQAAGLLEKVIAVMEKYAKPYPYPKPEEKAKKKGEKPEEGEEYPYPKPKKAKDDEEYPYPKPKKAKDEEEETEENGDEEKYPKPKKKAKKEYIMLDEKTVADLRTSLGVGEITQSVTALAQALKSLQAVVVELQQSDEEKVARKIQESSRILIYQSPPEIAGQKEAAEAAQGPGQVGRHPLADFPFGPSMTGGAS